MKKYIRFANLFVLTVVLPFVYGCGSGGGDVASLGSFLFGGGNATLMDSGNALPLELAVASTEAVGSAGLATIHNPEPATMLLMGSGVVAMAYVKSRKNRGSK